ncbi:MAG: DUF4837 family protein [Flavobacteriaceae bacterium]|nr:DUF4837 family protein [Flavobacteriaceae bacterium]
MKKNNIWISFGLFLLVVLGVSCKKDKASDYKMISQGPVGEIMLVIENKKLDTELGKTAKEILQTNYPGIPELVAESYFKVETMPPQNFKGYAKRHRSILQINISEKAKKNRVFQKDDIFAFEQKYMLVEAQNDVEAIRLLTAHKQQILDYFEEGEITHFTKLYMKESSDFSEKLSKTMGVWLSAPEYSVKRMEKEFAWASRETKRTSQAIMVYELPYTSKEQLTKEGLIAIKDKFLKKYVEGLDEGTYMRTETASAEVVRKVVEVNGYYGVELRGYWTLEGGFMGGPFLLIALVDEPNNRLLILDSYVFAPEAKYSKVKFIREIEGIFRTLKMTAKK